MKTALLTMFLIFLGLTSAQAIRVAYADDTDVHTKHPDKDQAPGAVAPGICQEGDDACYCAHHPGECDDAPAPTPDYTVSANHTEQAAHSAGLVGWTPTERAICGSGAGQVSVCRYKVKLTAGAAGSFECDLVCVVNGAAQEECNIQVDSCHLI